MRGRLPIAGACTGQSRRDRLVRAAGIAFAAAFALGPWRAAFAKPTSFDIATSDAATALAEFGRQSGREILFEYDLIAGQSTHPISGSYEPIEALRLMTAGTKLRLSESADGVLVVECNCALAGREAGPWDGRASPAAPSTTTAGPLAPSGLGPTHVAAKMAMEGNRADRIQEVLVTGSHIPQDAYSAPMPLTAIEQEDIADTGSENIAEAIVQLPSVSVGQGLSNTQSLVVGAGLSLVSLRGLGTSRTLVLVDGRRQVSGSPLSAAVDLNTIPAELVDRVEVVTGGTSAIYGADAIGGVINVILKKHFQGVSVRTHGGISSRGDGASRGVSLTAGKEFGLGGRPGNATLSFVYDSADGVSAGSRAYASNGLGLISNPAYQGPTGTAPAFLTRVNTGVNTVSNAGDFTVGDQTWIFTNDGSSIRPYDFGPLGDRSGESIGGDSVNPEPPQLLLEPIEREVFGGTLHQALSGSAELLLETRIAHTSVQTGFQPTFDTGDVSLSIDNPFLPAAAVALLQANNVDSIALHRINNEMGVRGTDNDRLMQQYVAGVDGTLPNQWIYDVSYAYGHTTESTLDTNDRNNALFIQSLDAVRDPTTGQIVCRDPSNGCVPLDLVGIGQASTAAIDFSRVDSLFRRRATQQVADADLTGELPGLSAGPFQFATGLEYRRESAASVPGPAEQAGELFLPQIAATDGGFDVREGYVELHLPLAKDRTLAHRLSSNAAFRLSDYDTSGLQTAWDGGFEYEPVDGFRLRATYSRSVRAPNIGELYSPRSTTFFFGQDPCDVSVNRVSSTRLDNCLALGIPADFKAPTDEQTLAAQVGGNPNLQPEIGKTWTAGFVWESSLLGGVSLAADYWDIAISHAVSAVPPQTIANDCVDSEIGVTSNSNCGLVTRDPLTHAIVAITATEENIASLHTAGVDMYLGWQHDVRPALHLPAGKLELTAVATWLRSLDLLGDAADPETLVLEGGVVGNPRWRAMTNLAYTTGTLRINWRTQFIGNARIAWFPGIPSNEYDLPMTGTALFHDVALELHRGPVTLHFTVNNVLDETPPARGFEIHSGTGVGAAIYPNLGRLFSASVGYQF
jgi:outer membrane receptor protein involved in Fe transport